MWRRGVGGKTGGVEAGLGGRSLGEKYGLYPESREAREGSLVKEGVKRDSTRTQLSTLRAHFEGGEVRDGETGKAVATKIQEKGAWLVQSVEHVPLVLRVMSSISTLGRELTKKKNPRKR